VRRGENRKGKRKQRKKKKERKEKTKQSLTKKFKSILSGGGLEFNADWGVVRNFVV